MKKKGYKALLFSLCLCALIPNYAVAKEEEEENFTLDINEWLEKVDEFENRIIRNKIPIYKQESLWLITDTPNVDPNEERHYYFIDKNNAKIKITTYYDNKGNKVEEDSASAIIKYEQKSYLPITLKDDSFVMRNTYNLMTGETSINFVDFDLEYYWEKEIEIEYGRFTDVSLIIPEEMQKEKYSAYDLEKILEVINNPEYEIFIEPLVKEIK